MIRSVSAAIRPMSFGNPFYCRAGVSIAIEGFTLAGGTPALNSGVKKQTDVILEEKTFLSINY